MERYVQNFLTASALVVDEMHHFAQNAKVKEIMREKDKVLKMTYTSALRTWLANQPEAIETHTIFNDFASISEYLGSTFNNYDYSDMMLYLVKRNIECGILNKFNKIKDFNIASGIMASGDFFLVLMNNKKRKSIYRKLDELSKKYMLKNNNKKGINLISFKSAVKMELLQLTHLIIKEHYLDKKDSFTKDDVKLICLAFSKLGVSTENVNLIKNSLENKIEIRENLKLEEERKQKLNENSKKEKFVPSYVIEQSINSNAKTTEDKIYNVCKRKLAECFDFDKKQPLRYLELKDITHCLYLLNEMGVSLEDRNKFIKIVEKYNRELEVTPVKRYLDLRGKIFYYGSLNEEILRILSDLDECFRMMESKDNDYTFYEEFMSIGLKEALSLIPKGYEYEYSEAQKLQLKGCIENEN